MTETKKDPNKAVQVSVKEFIDQHTGKEPTKPKAVTKIAKSRKKAAPK